MQQKLIAVQYNLVIKSRPAEIHIQDCAPTTARAVQDRTTHVVYKDHVLNLFCIGLWS